MSVAYLRRKRFEAKLLASEVSKMMFGEGEAGDNESLGTAPNGDKIVPADHMLADMGINF